MGVVVWTGVDQGTYSVDASCVVSWQPATPPIVGLVFANGNAAFMMEVRRPTTARSTDGGRRRRANF